ARRPRVLGPAAVVRARDALRPGGDPPLPPGHLDLVPPAAGRRARVGPEPPGRAPLRPRRALAVPRDPLAVGHRVELAEPRLPEPRVVRRRAPRGPARRGRRAAPRPGHPVAPLSEPAPLQLRPGAD